MDPDTISTSTLRKKYIIGACVLLALIIIGLLFAIFSSGGEPLRDGESPQRFTSKEKERIAESLRISTKPILPLSEAEKQMISKSLRRE